MENEIVILNPTQRGIYDSYAQKATNVIMLLSRKAQSAEDFANLKANIDLANKELKNINEQRMSLSRPIKKFADEVLAVPEKDLEKAINTAKNHLAKFNEYNSILDSYKRNRANLIHLLLTDYKLGFATQIRARNLANIDEFLQLVKMWKPKFNELNYTVKIGELNFRAVHNNATEILADWLLDYPFSDFYETLLEACKEIKEQALLDIADRKVMLEKEAEKPASIEVKQASEGLATKVEILKQEVQTPVFSDTNKYIEKGKLTTIEAKVKAFHWYLSRNYVLTKAFEDVEEKIVSQLLKEKIEFEGLEITKTLK